MCSKIVVYIIDRCTYLWSRTPWRQAYILLAFSKYVECDISRKRLATVGPKYCVEQFTEHDHWFWKRKITTREKWEIFFVPFHVIHRAKVPISFFAKTSGLVLTSTEDTS